MTNADTRVASEGQRYPTPPIVHVKTLFGSSCVCVGAYFAACSGSVLTRNTGYLTIAEALDFLVLASPFGSILILLLVGFSWTAKDETQESRALMLKLPLTCLVSLIPLAVHLTVIKLTFTVDPPPPKLFGPLSIFEWSILVLGCFLIGLGVSLVISRPTRLTR